MFNIISYILIFISQIFFNVFKSLEIKFTYENKLIPLLFNTVLINMVGLATTYFSIEGLRNGDYLIVIVYISGSVLGKWFAMTKMINYRFKIFDFFKQKDN